MSEIFIFGGTTEGRLLAEFCCKNRIYADISVATECGEEHLPQNEYLNIHTGRLDLNQMKMKLTESRCTAVMDATHPYAEQITAYATTACNELGIDYIRVKRSEYSFVYGTKMRDMDELVEYLNKSDRIILSTLGSKSLEKLTEVRDYRRRLWVRALPTKEAAEKCIALGFDENKLILEKGPFTSLQNKLHIMQCGAEIVVTKESGSEGGCREKEDAAILCGAELVTLMRPQESGISLDEARDEILRRFGEKK